MARKKVSQEREGMMTVKVTYPVMLGNRRIHPGETITVPADIAAEWREKEWAAYVTAEVKHGDGQDT